MPTPVGENNLDVTWSNRLKESHSQALTQRYVNLSIHTAPIFRRTNGMLHARDPAIWGSGTMTYASGSKHFDAWDQNLTTHALIAGLWFFDCRLYLSKHPKFMVLTIKPDM